MKGLVVTKSLVVHSQNLRDDQQVIAMSLSRAPLRPTGLIQGQAALCAKMSSWKSFVTIAECTNNSILVSSVLSQTLF
jgi:hypothetical protein